MLSFACLSISPIELLHPGIAVSVIRAGGIGILDREFCRDCDLERASQTLSQLFKLVTRPEAIGLRLRVDQITSSKPLLELLNHAQHWLILTGWQGQSLASIVASLSEAQTHRILLEVTDAQQVASVDPQHFPLVSGFVARGHESGGWVGEDSAFILLQKLLAIKTLPIYVQGGIGLHTATACRAAGAAGVLLDDQLWLMPESPMPASWQASLRNLNGQEAIAIGERLGGICRVLSRPGFQAIGTLQKTAQQMELQADGIEITESWQEQAGKLIGWGEPGNLAWPIGQAVGLAADFRDRYQTTGRFVQALLKTSEDNLRLAQDIQPLKAGSPLAISHGTEYPIVQGPMTRVSDTAEFANAVSKSGGLPLLALALMRGKDVQTLLQKAKELIGDRSWGIGILGFISHSLREEQIAAVNAIKPSFALIAGGRPDQAAQFEAQGIATYIHVPAPRLLKMFLEQGANRFVFEGRECGGHVGPLSSFVLWESMIATLLEDVPTDKSSQIHILFAGGIHDACSAAMVSAMAAPLAARGMKIGVLMGTAYLFTEEAVSCGAIVSEFQKQALSCTSTMNLETGPGHASRCAVTPFAREFYATYRQMLAAGNSPEDIKNTLEDLTLGRLRIASKGLTRSVDGKIVRVDNAQQQKDGMYMIGQVATLRHQVCNIRDLHRDISENSFHVLTAAFSSDLDRSQPAHPTDIAIVGIGTLLPKAQDSETFWANILNKIDAVTEIPAHRWDWRLYYDPDRHARDKIYSKWGGFLDDVAFDPLKYGIPPKSLKLIEPMQLLALEVVRQALIDAGYESGNFDRENTSVILGAGGGIADLGQQFATRSEIPRFVDSPSSKVWDRLPEWTEETFAGLLLNVIAGRVANRFNLGGSNFTVDAACASSLAALSLAVQELESGRSNVAIAGGIDTVQSPFAYFCFSKTQALSPRGKSRSFDKSADGIAISEGLAVVVLKRLADAERDGDRIYAVIKAVSSSSDGKALGMTAPLPEGQMRALKRAYAKAGFPPNTLGLYEAHGTGTAVGDRAELETITSTLVANQAASKSCAIGSVKTMIGHTKASAGIVGLVKATLALHHKVVPPHMQVENPLDQITDPESPVYLPNEVQPWLAHPDYPRRAGVSAFGFGGTNFHAVLEEYQGSFAMPLLGSVDWPCELLTIRAADRLGLATEVQRLQADLLAGAKPQLRDLAFTFAQRSQAQGHLSACLSVVVNSLSQLEEALSMAITRLLSPNEQTEPLPPHIQISLAAQVVEQPLAFLFPGQGSQYPGMVREVALYCPEVRQAIEFSDRHLRSCFPKHLSQYIYPPSAYSTDAEKQNQKQLTNTQIAQPALGTVAVGFMDLAARLGIKPTMTAGHSYGEYASLHCADVLSREDFLTLSAIRGRVIAEACEASEGAMAAVQMSREDLLVQLQKVDNVVIANHNAPLQSVISGTKQQVQLVVDKLNASGVLARMLPVSGAFHSPLVTSAQMALNEPIANTKMQLPKIPVYANATASPYQDDPAKIRQQLSEHLLSAVNFVGQIESMYANGARVFLELGPKSVLTNLVSQILVGKKFAAVSLDGQGGGMRGFLIALATLTNQGVGMQLTALYEGRDVKTLDLSRLVELTQIAALPKTTWLVTGGNVRLKDATVGYTGKEPPLTLETLVLENSLLADGSTQPKLDHSDLRPPLTDSKISIPSIPSKPKVDVPVEISVQSATTNAISNGNGKHNALTNGTIQKSPVLNSFKTPESTTARSTTVSMSKTPLPPNSSNLPEITGLPATEATALIAYNSYQETMRQFLSLQEQVMGQFLGYVQASQGHASLRALPTTDIAGAATHTNGYTPQNHNPQSHNQVYPPQPALPTVDIPKAMKMGSEEYTWTAPSSPEQVPTQSIPAIVPLPQIPQQVQPLAPISVATAHIHQTSPQVVTTASTVAFASQAELIQKLLELVSDRTGYPSEMLGLDQDLEADLGIDSIKRVEILGALQKILPQPLAANVQEQMESLTRVKSLNGIVEKLVQSSSVVTSAPVAAISVAPTSVTPSIETSVKPTAFDRTALIQTLVNLVSDRTGYPSEMLGLDQDLEADLGIDSIKRVEILGALQKILPQPLADALQQQMESLTRVKSLNALVEQVLAFSNGFAKEPIHLGKS
ncbi:6-deoxyerythronolide-B synthase [Tumidithrix helvetica PCC 7403]|uniref:beta-ketoacyl synthase N-terminal-like domain-containing protein n=1 Tax=Tumidithrix helvetica TaxID=3457545 RepID=UPI003C9770D6